MHESGVRCEDRVERDFALRVGTEVDCSGWCDSYEIRAQSFEQSPGTLVLHDVPDALVYTRRRMTVGSASWSRGRAKVRESDQSVPKISRVKID